MARLFKPCVHKFSLFENKQTKKTKYVIAKKIKSNLLVLWEIETKYTVKNGLYFRKLQISIQFMKCFVFVTIYQLHSWKPHFKNNHIFIQRILVVECNEWIVAIQAFKSI